MRIPFETKRISGVASPTKTATPPDFVLTPIYVSTGKKKLLGGRLSSYRKLASALSLLFLSWGQRAAFPAALLSVFPATAIVIAIMAAEIVTGFVVLTVHPLFPLMPQTCLALESLVPLALFAQMAFVFALANATNVLPAVMLARMVVSRRRNWHQREAGQ